MQSVEEAPGYRVLDQAGQGGFAIVYRAYQERLDRLVALKVLTVDRVDQRVMRRFQRELQLTGRLTGHPNVVTVFDTGLTRSGKPYIAMDFFEGGSLRDRIRRDGPLPVPDVLRTGVKLAGALAAVHDAGVLHGDIKPQNILISRYGEPAIADFGVARVVDWAEMSATAQAFTPTHAAPEVLSGQPHNISTDIYSLGSTLYHLLAGQPAFHSPTDPSIAPLMLRVLSNPPPPLTRADVPPVLAAAVLRAMSKNPQERYGSARELARRLQAIQAELGLPVTDLIGSGPPPPSAPPPSAPPSSAPAPSAPAQAYAPASGPVQTYAPAESAPSATPWGVSATRAPRPPSGRRVPLAIGLAVVVALAGTAIAVTLSLRSSPPDPGTTGASAAAKQPQAARSTPGISKESLAKLAPARLRVVADRGATITLSWALPRDARRYPLVLQREPADDVQLTALPIGSTETRVVGLDPRRGYCFVVGAILDISAKTTTTWSKPRCVRGAVPVE